MGQYYVLVNHDREEIVKPGKLGSGRKLWEITVSDMPRIMPYLMRQTASFGGGDPRVRLSRDRFEDEDGDLDIDAKLDAERDATEESYPDQGRWAGDRVEFLGDYSSKGGSGDYESKYQEARAEYEDISRRLAQQVREFIGDDDRSPRVPADPEQCDHDDVIIVEYGEEADGAGERYCRDCHTKEVVDTVEELE